MKRSATIHSITVPVALLGSVTAHADSGSSYTHMWNGFGMMWGPFGMLLWLGLLVIIIVIAARWLGGRSSPDERDKEEDPLAIVKARYARGEIDEDEYKRVCANLKEE